MNPSHPMYKPSKGAGKGDGWGGPAKGAGNGNLMTPMTKEKRQIMRAAAKDPEKVARRKKMKADRAERIKQLTDHLTDLALNAAREETRVSATVALLNRLDGMPTQRNENENRDVTLEKLLQQAAARRATDADGV